MESKTISTIKSENEKFKLSTFEEGGITIHTLEECSQCGQHFYDLQISIDPEDVEKYYDLIATALMERENELFPEEQGE